MRTARSRARTAISSAPSPTRCGSRGSAEFEDLAAYRRFAGGLVGRRNAHRNKRIELERAALRPLPPRRAEDGEEALVSVTSSGGFTPRARCSTPRRRSDGRLIGHRLRARLQVARRERALEGAIAKLDKYHLLVLDDLACVTKDQAETSALFEPIGARLTSGAPSRSPPIRPSASGTGSSQTPP